jgi:hypothetical protein
MSKRMGLVFVLALTVPLIANAQPIPAGVSEIDGNFNSTYAPPFCTGAELYDSVTGYLTNPGPGKVGTEVQLNFTYCGSSACDAAGTVMIVSNFPAQPSSGLNGWSSTLPALATQTQYLNGKMVLSTKMDVSFALTPITSRVSQGTMVITNGECPETVNLNVTHPG